MFKLKGILSSNRQVFHLVSGLAIAQLIPLAFSPVLSRLFTPADYAVLAIMISLLNIVTEVSTLRYDRSIVIADNESSAKNILFACFGIALGIGIISYPLTTFIYHYYLFKDEAETYQLLSAITPFILIFMGTVIASGFWFQRIKAHRVIVTNKIVQMAAITFVSLGLGYWGVKNGLVLGYLVGWTVLFLFTLFQLYQTNVKPKKDFQLEVAKRSLDQHSAFPKYNALPGLLNALAMSIPVFIIIDYYGNHEGGNFNMCRQLLLLPAGFISSSFSQVYYRRIAEAKNNGEKIFPHLKQMLLPGLYFGLPLVALVMLFGPEIFSFVLGDNWLLSGEYAKIYVLAVYVQFFALCLSITFPVMKLIKAESLFKGMYFLLVCSLFVLHIKSSEKFIIYYSIIEIIVFGSIIAYTLYKSKDH